MKSSRNARGQKEDAAEEIVDDRIAAMDSDEEILLQNDLSMDFDNPKTLLFTDSIAHSQVPKDSIIAVGQLARNPAPGADGSSTGQLNRAPLPASFSSDPAADARAPLPPLFSLDGHTDSINSTRMDSASSLEALTDLTDTRAWTQPLEEVLALPTVRFSTDPTDKAQLSSDRSVIFYILVPTAGAWTPEVVLSYHLQDGACMSGTWRPEEPLLATIYDCGGFDAEDVSSEGGL
ncbi:hypothetical protein CEK25_004616 [Fusarium fujikuroi]|nr:hypothetical protein CEK25_004616 [Fusarium fujikuroi]